jgi:hypothetical protein
MVLRRQDRADILRRPGQSPVAAGVVVDNRVVAATAVIGATVITLADMPRWTVEPYIGWIAATTGVAILGQFAPGVAKGLGGLMLAALLLSRGPEALAKVNRIGGR